MTRTRAMRVSFSSFWRRWVKRWINYAKVKKRVVLKSSVSIDDWTNWFDSDISFSLVDSKVNDKVDDEDIESFSMSMRKFFSSFADWSNIDWIVVVVNAIANIDCDDDDNMIVEIDNISKFRRLTRTKRYDDELSIASSWTRVSIRLSNVIEILCCWIIESKFVTKM